MAGPVLKFSIVKVAQKGRLSSGVKALDFDLTPRGTYSSARQGHPARLGAGWAKIYICLYFAASALSRVAGGQGGVAWKTKRKTS